TPTSTAPRHRACCLLAKAPPPSHALPLARRPPSCRSRLRGSPLPPSASTRTGDPKLCRIGSRPLLSTIPLPPPPRPSVTPPPTPPTAVVRQVLLAISHRLPGLRAETAHQRRQHRGPSIGDRLSSKAEPLCFLDESNQHARRPGGWRVVGADPDSAVVTHCLAGQPVLGPEPSRIPAVHFDRPAHRRTLHEVVSQRRQRRLVVQTPGKGRPGPHQSSSRLRR